MAKFTPDGCSIDFILYLRTELDPCNIRFDLVRGIDNNVTIPDSVISLTSDKHILFDKSPVVTSDSTIKILSDEMGIFCRFTDIGHYTTIFLLALYNYGFEWKTC